MRRGYGKGPGALQSLHYFFTTEDAEFAERRPVYYDMFLSSRVWRSDLVFMNELIMEGIIS
jgi:hypothetical protein